jgi:hypothetical protein
MGLFNVNFKILINTYLKGRWRNSVMLAWLGVLVSPVVYVYGLFIAYMAVVLYELSINGQVCLMEKALNDTFDTVLRRIYIADPIYDDPIWLYLDDEEKPVWLYLDSEDKPLWLYLDSEVYADGGVQFVVYVPAGLVYDTNRMKALINKYRLVSKTNYVIQSF